MLIQAPFDQPSDSTRCGGICRKRRAKKSPQTTAGLSTGEPPSSNDDVLLACRLIDLVFDIELLVRRNDMQNHSRPIIVLSNVPKILTISDSNPPSTFGCYSHSASGS